MNTSSASSSTTTPNSSSNDRRYHIVNALAYVLNVAVTYGVGVAGERLGGFKTNAELSRQYQTLVTPVGWAFSIWGVIFLAQAIWVIRPFLTTADDRAASVGYKYVAVCLAQIGWTAAFSTESIWLSFVFMALLFVCLWKIVFALLQENGSNYFSEKFPFTIHAGWISAALVVNACVLLVALEVSYDIQFYVALAGLATLALVASVMTIRQEGKGDLVIPLVLAWALFGVYFELQNTSDQTILGNFTSVQIDTAKIHAAALSAFITVGVALRAILSIIGRFRSQPEGTSEEAVYLRAD